MTTAFKTNTMILTINTETKTVSVKGTVPMKELNEKLKELGMENYSLQQETESYPVYPYYQPYYQWPTVPYWGTVSAEVLGVPNTDVSLQIGDGTHTIHMPSQWCQFSNQ